MRPTSRPTSRVDRKTRENAPDAVVVGPRPAPTVTWYVAPAVTGNLEELINRSLVDGSATTRSFSPASRSLGSSRAIAGLEISHPLSPSAKSPLGIREERGAARPAVDRG